MARYAWNKASLQTKRRFFELIRQGVSGQAASFAVGVSPSCGSLWFIDADRVSFIEHPISRRYFSQDDRIEIWPQATVQLCVVHLVRASLRYASKAHWGQITKALRIVYTAPTIEAAESRFDEFEADWGDRYPVIIKLWRTAWEQFTPFLAFPPEIRRVVYTTNAIESLNSRLRQATRRRGHFPHEQAALKVLYLVIRDRKPNRANVTGKTSGWKTALNQLALYYGDRITEN